jgi:hypothetical protein
LPSASGVAGERCGADLAFGWFGGDKFGVHILYAVLLKIEAATFFGGRWWQWHGRKNKSRQQMQTAWVVGRV